MLLDFENYPLDYNHVFELLRGRVHGDSCFTDRT